MLAAQIVRIITASLSCLASSTILICILKSPARGLCSPYSRIIFGLSAADIIQSVGIIASPFTAPSNTPNAPWAVGNTGTCDATGFILNLGGTVVPFYTLFLSYYFLKRVKCKMTPHEFAHKYEKLIHIIIWIFPIIAGAVGVARGDFNPARAGSLCMFADHPYDCSSDPGTYGNCNRGQDSSFDALYILVIPFLLTFLVLIVNLMRLTVHVFLEERSLYNNNTAKRRMKKDQQPQDHNENEPSSLRKSCWEIFALLTCSCFLTQSIQEIIDDTARNAESQEVDAPLDTSHQSLAMQSLVQSSLYIFAFIFSYSIIVINFVMAAHQSFGHWEDFSTYSFIRPKISVIRRNVPGASEELWITLLLVVIFSGGEVPCEIDFGVGCSEDEINYLRPKREYADELSSYLKMRNVSNEGILNDSIPFSGTLQLMAKTSPDLISHEESCEKEIRWFYTTIFEIDKSRSERENGTKIMRNNTLHHDADPKRLAMERLAAD